MVVGLALDALEATEGDSLGAGESVGNGPEVALGVGEASGEGTVLSDGDSVDDGEGSDVRCSITSRPRADGVSLAFTGTGEETGSTSSGLAGAAGVLDGSTEGDSLGAGESVGNGPVVTLGVGEAWEPSGPASESTSHTGGNSPELECTALVASCPSLNEAPETRADGVSTSAAAAMTRLDRRANPP